MAEHDSRAHENAFEKAREHVRHGTDRVKQIRFPGHHPHEDADTKEGPHVSERRPSEESLNKVESANVDDLPYDSNREDGFTSELMAACEEDDGMASPKSQCSMDTLYSSASNASWTSTQKNVGGVVLKDGRSQEVLGPYKQDTKEGASEDVPADYEEYVHQQTNGKPSQNGTAHAGGTHGLERSSSTASDQSYTDSLYADLSSISDRDLQVPEGLVKGDNLDGNYDGEGKVSPNRPSQVRQHISNLKLH